MVTVNTNYYPNYPRGWEGNVPVPEPLQHNDAVAGLDRSAPPLTVARALREHCNIPFETFFLAAHLGGGKFAYFQGPRPLSEEEIRAVFKRERFLTYSNPARESRPREDFSQTHDPAYSLDTGYSARTAQHFEDQWPMESRRRKRPRRHARRDDDDDAPPIIASSKKAIEIGDSDTVLEFYDRGFKAIQQTACKEVAKAVIKVICPKKQALYPYRKGAASAPDWWPKPSGPDDKDIVRHVEPDHLWKRERVHVLKHILRLIVEPGAQPPSIRRLGPITVAMLETAAMDSLSVFFQDASKPKNVRKRPIVKEIFKVAKMEERYKRNEIDGTTQVFVQADDMMDYCFDADEPDEDMEEAAAEAAIKHDRTSSVTSSQVSPARTTAMPLSSLSPATSTVHSLAAQFQSTEFIEMPMRTNQYGGPAMDLNPDQYAYDGLPSQASMQAHATASLQLHDILTANQHQHQHQHHDASRRSSMFTPTTDYASHSPAAMYHSPWSQPQSPQSHPTPITSAASSETSSPLFAYAPAHHPQQHAAAMPTLPLPMPMAQHQHHHHQQQQQPGNPYAGQYSPHDTLAAAQNHVHHHHHQQHQQQQPQQQPQQHVFRAGSIHMSLQHHPGAAGYGQGQSQD